MKATIGLGVGSSAVRALAVRGTAIEWTAEARVEGNTSLVDAVREVLAFVPRSRWRRVAIRAALGPSAAQVKVLRDLPPVDDPRALSAIVRENAHRFFLRDGAPLVTGQLVEVGDGGVRAAAFDGRVVDQVREACELEKLSLEGVVPAVAVLPHVLSGELIVWHDGSVAAEIVRGANGPVIHIRRATDLSEPVADPDADSRLVDLGEEGWRFADALGAATTERDPLTYDPRGRGATDTRHGGAANIRRAAMAALVAWLAAILAPGIVATMAAGRAEDRLQELTPRWAEASRVESELSEIHGALEQVTNFSESARSPVLLLGDLAETLPDDGVIGALTLDSSAVTLSVVVPHATAFVEALDELAALRSPRVSGPILRQNVDGATYERATIEFSLEGAGQRAPPRRDTGPMP